MNKRTIEGGKRLSTIHFKNLNLEEELGEQTRVSAGNPFHHSDSAVKLSTLAGRIGGAILVSHLQRFGVMIQRTSLEIAFH